MLKSKEVTSIHATPVTALVLQIERKRDILAQIINENGCVFSQTEFKLLLIVYII